MKREEKRVRLGATNDADFTNAAFEGALGSFKLENHAAGNDSALNEALDLFASDGGKNLFAVENTSDICEIDQLIGFEKLGAGGSHMVGVDVVQLVVGAEAEAGSDGNEPFAPERFNESVVEAGEI